MKIITVSDNEFSENTYIVSDEGRIFIIDPGSIIESIEAAVLQLSVQSKTGNWKSKISGILLTHAHYDHILSLPEFDPKIVWLHESERRILEDPGLNISALMGLRLSVKGVNYVSGAKGEVNGFEFIHVPGHTSGCVLIKKGGVMFTGDTLFFDTVGRTDLPTGDSRMLQNSLTIFAGFDKNIMCYPGHGEPFRLGDSYEVNYFLKG